jgi:putative membrane protein
MSPLRPRAYPLHDSSVEIEQQEDPFAQSAIEEAEEAVEEAQARGLLKRSLLTWGGIFWSALTALLTLAFSVWVYDLITDFYMRIPALGYVTLALVSLMAFALIIFITRELRAVWRQRALADLHQTFAQAYAQDDRDTARALTRKLAAIYEARASTARARREVLGFTSEIIDGRDLVELTERHLMSALDEEVTREIALAAKRVSVVTAVSPRAVIDLLFVLAQAARLIRRISEIYGARPGFFGFLRLARSVTAHLAITGGMAVGDSLVQQAIGHGLAAKLSARLGEGVLNGLMSARIGLSAMALCRPMPFLSTKQPGIRDVAPFLFSKK